MSMLEQVNKYRISKGLSVMTQSELDAHQLKVTHGICLKLEHDEEEEKHEKWLARTSRKSDITLVRDPIALKYEKLLKSGQLIWTVHVIAGVTEYIANTARRYGELVRYSSKSVDFKDGSLLVFKDGSFVTFVDYGANLHNKEKTPSALDRKIAESKARISGELIDGLEAFEEYQITTGGESLAAILKWQERHRGLLHPDDEKRKKLLLEEKVNFEFIVKHGGANCKRYRYSSTEYPPLKIPEQFKQVENKPSDYWEDTNEY